MRILDLCILIIILLGVEGMQITVGVETDLKQLLGSRAGQLHYCEKLILLLQLKENTQLKELMNILQRLYQQVTDFDVQLPCEIIPSPLDKIVCNKYHKVALGGTFDRLHAGHRMLLTYSALLLDLKHERPELIIGITEDTMLQNKKGKEFLQSYYSRRDAVQDLLTKLGVTSDKARLFRLYDGYGPTITQADIDALVVTQETLAGGTKINEIRSSKELHPLKVYVMELIEDTTSKNKVSSTILRQRIRNKNNVSSDQVGYIRKKWDTLFESTINFLDISAAVNGQVQQQLKLKWFQKLFDLYSQRWRYYHTNRHICDLHKRHDQTSKVFNPTDQAQALALEWSIWFHDAIYLPPSKHNEEKSAELFQEFIQELAVNIPPGSEAGSKKSVLLKHVVDVILSTKTHICDTHLSKVFSDLDMSVLDSPWSEYLRYSQAIKKQYAPIFGTSVKQFYVKRGEFLQKLDPETVFYYHKPESLFENITKQRSLCSSMSECSLKQ